MKRVLVVDDSPIMRRLIAARLEAVGFTIVGTAEDGVAGLEQYKTIKPDWVFLDVTMPNMDGRECLEMIRKVDACARVVMLSAITDPKLAEECRKLGALEFLTKDLLQQSGSFENKIMDLTQQRSAA